MAEEDKSQKTEKPTQKRVSEAKDRGQVAVSQELKSWASLLAATVALVLFAPWTMQGVARIGETFLERPHSFALDPASQRILFGEILSEIALVLAPIIGLFVITGIAVSVAQVGWNTSVEKLKPKFNRFSPKNGISKMLGPRSWVQFTKGVLKVAIVGTVSFLVVTPMLADITLLPQLDIVQSLDRMHEIAIRLGLATASVMTVVAVLDYIYQKYEHTNKLKMTKQEVKDEFRQLEGDPKIKARLAKIRTERARARMIAAVPSADVVITNPTHYAVALEYKMDTMPAPKVVAKGVDSLALRIREVAEEHEVAVVENPPLARALYSAVELDQEIPPEHYVAVAEVIGYVFRLKGKLHGMSAERDSSAYEFNEASGSGTT